MVVPIIQCQSSVKTHQSLVCPPIWLCLCFCPPRYTKWIWRLWCLRLLCGGGGIEDAMVWESSQLYIYLHMQINWVWKSVSNFYHEGKIKILIGLTVRRPKFKIFDNHLGTYLGTESFSGNLSGLRFFPKYHIFHNSNELSCSTVTVHK